MKDLITIKANMQAATEIKERLELQLKLNKLQCAIKMQHVDQAFQQHGDHKINFQELFAQSSLSMHKPRSPRTNASVQHKPADQPKTSASSAVYPAKTTFSFMCKEAILDRDTEVFG